MSAALSAVNQSVRYCKLQKIFCHQDLALEPKGGTLSGADLDTQILQHMSSSKNISLDNEKIMNLSLEFLRFKKYTDHKIFVIQIATL